MQPMQSLSELRAISYGFPLVVHLLRSVNNANDDHRKALAGLGILQDRPRGKRHRFPDTHIGRVVQLDERVSVASAAHQELTRYVFFDPGDEVLDAYERSLGMSVERFKTSQDLPAILVEPKGGRSIRFESQPDGFGMVWPTGYGAVEALRRALSVLPSPDVADKARVVRASGAEATCRTDDLLRFLEQDSGVDRPSLVRAGIGTAGLAWGNTAGEGSASSMSFGDDYYVRPLIAELLAQTIELPKRTNVASILDEVDETLKAHIPPQGG